MKRALVPLAALLVAACGDFETRSIVLDLRVLAISVTPPEVVVPADMSQIDINDIPDVEVCALVADPADQRRLTWFMEVCAPTDSRRCDDPDATVIKLAQNTIADPEAVEDRPGRCATLPASGELIGVVTESLQNDPLSGFDGVDVQISFRIGPEGGADNEFIFASKTMTYAQQIPSERVANSNPWLRGIVGLREPGIRGQDFEVPLGRCGDIAPVEVPAGAKVGFLPDEADGVRETYVIPSFDGESREFTENIRYSWYATVGDWGREVTGGTKDIFGNQPPIDSKWEAPTDDIPADGLVPIWVIQQDERGGLAWYESCVHISVD